MTHRGEAIGKLSLAAATRLPGCFHSQSIRPIRPLCPIGPMRPATLTASVCPARPFPGGLGEIGKVEAGVGTVKLDGFEVAGDGSLGFAIERAQAGPLVCTLDPGIPFALVPIHADEARGRSRLLSPALEVADILLHRADAEVAPAIVQAVAVDVVHHHPLGRSHDELMHADVPAAVRAIGIDLSTCRRGMPSVLVEPFVVGGVDDGVLALSESDVTHIVAWGFGRLNAKRRLPSAVEVAARGNV